MGSPGSPGSSGSPGRPGSLRSPGSPENSGSPGSLGIRERESSHRIASKIVKIFCNIGFPERFICTNSLDSIYAQGLSGKV